MAHCHDIWLGIGGSSVRIQTTLQAALDPGLTQKYKKKISSQKKHLNDNDLLHATKTNKINYRGHFALFI